MVPLGIYNIYNNHGSCLRESTNSTYPEESAKASRSLEELRSELDARREAQADALARQRKGWWRSINRSADVAWVHVLGD